MDGIYIDPPTVVTGLTYDSSFESQKWREQLERLEPISIPDGCGFTPIPPFCGAVVRFLVRCLSTNARVSIYLDCYNNLGFCGAPYWEIYPYPCTSEEDGTIYVDTMRCDMGDIKALSQGLADSIAYLRNKASEEVSDG